MPGARVTGLGIGKEDLRDRAGAMTGPEDRVAQQRLKEAVSLTFSVALLFLVFQLARIGAAIWRWTGPERTA
jgi:hypothetical protein